MKNFGIRENAAVCALLAFGLALAACSNPAGDEDGFLGRYVATEYNGQRLPGTLSRSQDGTQRTIVVGGHLTDGTDINLFFTHETWSASGTTLLESRADTVHAFGPFDHRTLSGGRVQLVFEMSSGGEILLTGRKSDPSRLELDLCGGCGTQVLEFRRQ